MKSLMLGFPNLEDARTQEAQRRLMLLGPFSRPEYKYNSYEATARARHVMVSRGVFNAWYDAYKAKGFEGLKPDWKELSDALKANAWERLSLLGPLAMSEYVSADQITQVTGGLVDPLKLTDEDQGDESDGPQCAEGGRWSVHSYTRWMRRFRNLGLWGLATLSTSALEEDGKRTKKRTAKRRKCDLGALDEEALRVLYRRRDFLGDLADKKKVTRQEVRERAAEVGVSESTLWEYLRVYRADGLMGLAPAERSDKGTYHIISNRMVEIVRGIRLTLVSIPETRVYEIACEKAELLREIAPTASQVRSICAAIEEPMILLSKGHVDQFRNRFQITYPIIFEDVVYQIDIKDSIPVLCVDVRDPKYRTPTGEFRPYLITCLESNSRLLVSRRFTYDYPNRFDIAGVIRDALRITEKKPYGGKPNEIWVDNGMQLVANHVKNFCKDVRGGIILHLCRPGNPKERGRGERFFETIETRVWSELDGYVGPNLQERNPNAKAKLTLKELVAKFDEFIEKYHAEVHSVTGQAPLEYFYEHCYAPSVDDRELDMLLLEKLPHTVLKAGIKKDKRIYWAPELANIVGKRVDIRADAPYAFSDVIEVFLGRNWLCTAIADDSEAGRAVTPATVGAAQAGQLRYLRGEIKQARDALKAADLEIEARAKNVSAQLSPPPVDPASEDVFVSSVVGNPAERRVDHTESDTAPINLVSIPAAISLVADASQDVHGATVRRAKPSSSPAIPVAHTQSNRPKREMTFLERQAAKLALAIDGEDE
jgi:hypothetical protein